MRRRVILTPIQWKTLSNICSNMGQAITLFAFAAFFVPQAVNLPENFSKGFSLIVLANGLIILGIAVTMARKEK